jgi:hypothetical protein
VVGRVVWVSGFDTAARTRLAVTSVVVAAAVCVAAAAQAPTGRTADVTASSAQGPVIYVANAVSRWAGARWLW